jgi:anti-sigma factor RsiW
MSRTDEEQKRGSGLSSDRALWQRCRTTDAPEDAAARFLDLAAFADGRLDADEEDRVAALLAADPAARDDVAAARALASGVAETPSTLERIVDRACAILPGLPAAPGRVVPFTPPPGRHRILHGLAQWGSLAAAIAMASWLGFAMGSDASLMLSQPSQSSDVSVLPELLDPGAGFLRDLGESPRT